MMSKQSHWLQIQQRPISSCMIDVTDSRLHVKDLLACAIQCFIYDLHTSMISQQLHKSSIWMKSNITLTANRRHRGNTTRHPECYTVFGPHVIRSFIPISVTAHFSLRAFHLNLLTCVSLCIKIMTMTLEMHTAHQRRVWSRWRLCEQGDNIIYNDC